MSPLRKGANDANHRHQQRGEEVHTRRQGPRGRASLRQRGDGARQGPAQHLGGLLALETRSFNLRQATPLPVLILLVRRGRA